MGILLYLHITLSTQKDARRGTWPEEASLCCTPPSVCRTWGGRVPSLESHFPHLYNEDRGNRWIVRLGESNEESVGRCYGQSKLGREEIGRSSYPTLFYEEEKVFT